MSKNNNEMLLSKDWGDIYLIGIIAIILSEIVIFLSIAGTFIWPYAPGNKSMEEIFQLLHDNLMGGLISLDLLLVLGNIIGILIFIALFASLKEINKSWALTAFVLGIFAVILIIPARPIAELVSLSKSYAGATSEILKNRYLASGESLIAMFNGTNWIVNTFFGGFSFLISSVLMLKSEHFGKTAGWIGIISNIFVCLFFIPVIGIYLLLISMIGYIVWYILIAKGLFRLWKMTKKQIGT